MTIGFSVVLKNWKSFPIYCLRVTRNSHFRGKKKQKQPTAIPRTCLLMFKKKKSPTFFITLTIISVVLVTMSWVYDFYYQYSTP